MFCGNNKILVAESQHTAGCTFDFAGDRWGGARFDSAFIERSGKFPEWRGKGNRDGVIQGKLRQLAAFGKILRIVFCRTFAKVASVAFIHEVFPLRNRSHHYKSVATL